MKTRLEQAMAEVARTLFTEWLAWQAVKEARTKAMAARTWRDAGNAAKLWATYMEAATVLNTAVMAAKAARAELRAATEAAKADTGAAT